MIKFLISTFVIFIFSVNFVFSNETKLPPSQFQTSMGDFQKKLHVRHKMLGVKERSYKAKFVVHNLDNKETYYSDIIVVKDKWGEVTFPEDFFNRKIIRPTVEETWAGIKTMAREIKSEFVSG